MNTAFRMEAWNGFHIESGLACSLFSANSVLSSRNWFALSKLRYMMKYGNVFLTWQPHAQEHINGILRILTLEVSLYTPDLRSPEVLC